MALRRRDAKGRSNKSSLNNSFSDTPKFKKSSKKKKSNPLNSFKSAISSPAKNFRRISNDPHHKDEAHKCINISDILKVNFKVFRVSPIYNFNEKKLRVYERKLIEELTAFNFHNENTFYEAKLLYEKLEFDQIGAIIQITITSSNKKYNGYLISLTTNEKDLSLRHFPVLLVQGGGLLVKQVHSIMCKFFDCDIHPAVFSFQALMTVFTSMAHFFADKISDLSSEEVSLHYKIPGCALSDSIVVAIPLAATSTVFAVFTHEFGEVLNTSQLILGFYNRIINQILNVYRVDLSPAELFKISFPFCTITSEGSVKFSSQDIIGRILLIIENFIKLEYNVNPYKAT